MKNMYLWMLLNTVEQVIPRAPKGSFELGEDFDGRGRRSRFYALKESTVYGGKVSQQDLSHLLMGTQTVHIPSQCGLGFHLIRLVGNALWTAAHMPLFLVSENRSSW